MMKKNWKQEFKKITQSKGRDPLKMEITPYHDWRLAVIIFFGGLIGSLAFNIYMSIEISKDNFFAAPPRSVGVVKFNQEGLAKVMKSIDEKTALFEKVKNNEGAVAVDPSL
jgi:hypothetical protein